MSKLLLASAALAFLALNTQAEWIHKSGSSSTNGDMKFDWKWAGEDDKAANIKAIGEALDQATKFLKHVDSLGLLEEDQWGGEVYGEANGGSGRPTDWKVGGKITFDEQEAEQKFKLGKALKKAANVVVKAHEIGLLEEEMDTEQKFKIGKVLKKTANVLTKAKELGLFDEEEWNGEIYGEAGRQNGQSNWKVGGKVTFDEDEEELQGGSLSGSIGSRGYSVGGSYGNNRASGSVNVSGGYKGSPSVSVGGSYTTNRGGNISGQVTRSGSGSYSAGLGYTGSVGGGQLSVGATKNLSGRGFGAQIGWSRTFDEEEEQLQQPESVKTGSSSCVYNYYGKKCQDFLKAQEEEEQSEQMLLIRDENCIFARNAHCGGLTTIKTTDILEEDNDSIYLQDPRCIYMKNAACAQGGSIIKLHKSEILADDFF